MMPIGLLAANLEALKKQSYWALAPSLEGVRLPVRAKSPPHGVTNRSRPSLRRLAKTFSRPLPLSKEAIQTESACLV